MSLLNIHTKRTSEISFPYVSLVYTVVVNTFIDSTDCSKNSFLDLAAISLT